MRLASIDIGTNSVKLAVAEVEDQKIKNIILERTEITRLGEDINKTNMLRQEAMDRTLEILKDFKLMADNFGAQEIIAVATSAMRDAKNRDEFIKSVNDTINIEPWVVTGDEEAELTFIGACSDPQLYPKKLALVDVGGGSTELILGQNGKIEDKFSINAGCVRLTEEFIHSDPISTDEIQNMLKAIISLFYSRLSRIDMSERELVGVGGTITTLAAIHQGINDYKADSIHRYVMSKEDIVSLLSYLKRMSLEERKKIQGLHPKRADIIVAGAAIFSTIMEILKAREIIVSTRGLRYGTLLKMARG